MPLQPVLRARLKASDPVWCSMCWRPIPNRLRHRSRPVFASRRKRPPFRGPVRKGHIRAQRKQKSHHFNDWLHSQRQYTTNSYIYIYIIFSPWYVPLEFSRRQFIIKATFFSVEEVPLRALPELFRFYLELGSSESLVLWHLGQGVTVLLECTCIAGLFQNVQQHGRNLCDVTLKFSHGLQAVGILALVAFEKVLMLWKLLEVPEIVRGVRIVAGSNICTPSSYFFIGIKNSKGSQKYCLTDKQIKFMDSNQVNIKKKMLYHVTNRISSQAFMCAMATIYIYIYIMCTGL